MAQALLQIAVLCALLVVAMPLLGGYMARVFTGAEGAGDAWYPNRKIGPLAGMDL